MTPRAVFGAALVFLLAAGLARSDDVQIQEGMVVSAAAKKLVIIDKDGTQHSYTVESNVPVTVHGKPGKLEDLKKSTKVKVTTGKDRQVMSVATIDLDKNGN